MSAGAEVLAAGGAVVRDGLVAVVHRPKYGDWTLPKGKLEPGEGFEEAALREVLEETGLRCRLVRPLGDIRYEDAKGRPKLVRYWEMRVEGGAFRPTDEVDELRWAAPGDAAGLLSYARDRDVLARLGES